jgi:hypothetical protein
MIDVEALIGQIVPQIVLALRPVNRLDRGPRDRNCGIQRVVMSRHPWSLHWLDEEEQQHGCERDNKRAADHRRGSCIEGIRERIFEDVEPPTKEGHDEEADKAPESTREPAAHDQRLWVTHTRSVMDDPAAHGSILGIIPESERRLRES